MLQPDPGQLLQALRTALAETVVPTLDDPGARRQMNAALHLLARLARCWDLPQALLRADNDDIEDFLERLPAGLAAAGPALPESPAGPTEGEPHGYNDPATAALAARNRVLRRQVEAVECAVLAALPDPAAATCLEALGALCRRMTDRDCIAAGDLLPGAAPIALEAASG